MSCFYTEDLSEQNTAQRRTALPSTAQPPRSPSARATRTGRPRVEPGRPEARTVWTGQWRKAGSKA